MENEWADLPLEIQRLRQEAFEEAYRNRKRKKQSAKKYDWDRNRIRILIKFTKSKK